MEPHRPQQNQAIAQDESADSSAIDRDWLENKALRYVARWEACRASVTELLERKVLERAEAGDGGCVDDARDAIAQIVEDLVAKGYVDDLRFAEIAFARARREGRSAAQIRSRLVAKGIPSDVIERLFREEADREEADRDDAARDGNEESSLGVEERAAVTMARRKRLGPFRTDPDQRRARRDRDLAALARQGFDQELATRIIDSDSLAESD